MRNPAIPSAGLESPADMHLRDYLRIILKRKWVIVGLFVSVVAGTTLYVLMQPSVYESTVSLLVEPSGPNVISKSGEDVYNPTPTNVSSVDYYKTQYEILKGYKILREAALRLNLKAHAEYSAKPIGPLDSWLDEIKDIALSVITSAMTSPTEQKGSLPESESERRLVVAFQQHVTVKPVLNSRIIRVSVESTDPQFAAAAANTIASVYITRSLEMKSGAAEEAAKWITSRVEEIRQKVEQSDQALQEFASRYGLVNVDDRRRLGTQKLGELNAQLVQAETKRAEAEARFEQIASVLDTPRALESSAEVLNSTLIQNLRNDEVRASQKVAELSEKYGPKHPSMMQATSELKELRTRIQQEIKKIFVSVKAEYDVARARERVIRNALNKQKAEVMVTGQHEIQYGILEREAQSHRQLYDTLLKRMKETDLATEIRMGNIYVADPAIVSLVPVKPKKRQTILLAALFSLLGGLGLAFFLDYMDNSLKSADDLALHLPGLAFLGFLPVFSESRKSQVGVDLAAHEAPHSIFAEHIRSIRTSLLLSAADKPPSSILVTSSAEGEGKSTFAIGLAIAFAQLGHPTILVDGDFRKPRLHKVFGLEVTKGLTHHLVGEASLKEIMQPTGVPNLKVIPCGAIPPNPAELLQSKHMAGLLESFKKEEVYVVVDCAPVLAVADPIIAGHYVDGVILVIRAARTARQAVRTAARLLNDGNAKVLGVVLQRLKRREMPYYHYSEKYYGREPDKSLVRRS